MKTADCATLDETSPISKLGFDSRVNTVLGTKDIKKIGDLTKLCACGVLDIPGIAWKTLETIMQTLRETGFALSRECQHHE